MSKTINVKVYPGSKEQKIQLEKDLFEREFYKIHLKSIPEKGKANDELQRLLSEHFNVPKNNILISGGLTSRYKTVKIVLTVTD